MSDSNNNLVESQHILVCKCCGAPQLYQICSGAAGQLLPAERAVYTYSTDAEIGNTLRGFFDDDGNSSSTGAGADDARSRTGTYIVAKQGNTFYIVKYEADTGSEWDRLLPTYQRMVESVEFTD